MGWAERKNPDSNKSKMLCGRDEHLESVQSKPSARVIPKELIDRIPEGWFKRLFANSGCINMYRNMYRGKTERAKSQKKCCIM